MKEFLTFSITINYMRNVMFFLQKTGYLHLILNFKDFYFPFNVLYTSAANYYFNSIYALLHKTLTFPFQRYKIK